MLFNSLLFLAFFALIFVVVWPLRNHVRARNIFLLLAGWVFYGAWDWRFLFLLIGTSTLDYTMARLIDSSPQDQTSRRKWLVTISVVGNLAVLGFFKYCNFFIDSFIRLGQWVGIELHSPTLQIILPVGISFYTFQSIAYVIDVYRHHLRAERSWIDYLTFIGFFPQLVAGPIERATHLLPQIKAPNIITWNNVSSGFCLASFGMFKKVVLADNISRVVDAVFNPDLSNGATPVWWNTVIATYAFALQIYFDFSAYSDIARGVSRMLGFDLMRNFDLPYFATNPSDFWRRWHISLSTWLRDYLYIPLGGNRGGWSATYRNLFLTMLLGGLWHGATWLFVIWGAYHGILLCVHRAIKPFLDRHLTFHHALPRGIWTTVRIAFFFQLTAIGWFFFRGTSVTNMMRVLGISSDGTVEAVNLLTPALLATFASAAAVLFISQLCKYLSNDQNVIDRFPVVLRAIVYAGLMLGILIYGEFGGGDFIYFQF